MNNPRGYDIITNTPKPHISLDIHQLFIVTLQQNRVTTKYIYYHIVYIIYWRLQKLSNSLSTKHLNKYSNLRRYNLHEGIYNQSRTSISSPIYPVLKLFERTHIKRCICFHQVIECVRASKFAHAFSSITGVQVKDFPMRPSTHTLSWSIATTSPEFCTLQETSASIYSMHFEAIIQAFILSKGEGSPPCWIWPR